MRTDDAVQMDRCRAEDEPREAVLTDYGHIASERLRLEYLRARVSQSMTAEEMARFFRPTDLPPAPLH